MLEVLDNGYRLALVAREADFQLVFEHRGDRWVHYLGAFLDMAMLPNHDPRMRFEADHARIVSSVEDDSDRAPNDAVNSPTFQDLHHDKHGNAHRVFLIGQFAHHHFSAVFDLREYPNHVELSADITDRCRDPLECVASTYCVKTVAEPQSLEGSAFHWSVWPSVAELHLAATPPNRLEHLQFTHIKPLATVVSVIAPLPSVTHTHRWQYRWVWTKAAPGNEDV
jgi:hypothetical protein